tara:strand:+ start:175 stop:417 length:243 start_codon:yes stop_codon:yes gene_type:complete
MASGAGIRIFAVYFKRVFINVVTMHMMQVPVVQIVTMVAVFNSSMATTGTMLMWMVWVFFTIAHGDFPQRKTRFILTFQS